MKSDYNRHTSVINSCDKPFQNITARIVAPRIKVFNFYRITAEARFCASQFFYSLFNADYILFINKKHNGIA